MIVGPTHRKEHFAPTERVVGLALVAINIRLLTELGAFCLLPISSSVPLWLK